MKQTLFLSNTASRRQFAAVCGAVLLAGGSLGALAQSIGVNFVNDGSGGVVNSAAASLLPSELAGAAPYTQENWNNLSKWGSGVTLTDSAGSATALTINWDAGWSDSSGTAAGLGTPDGKLMDGCLAGNTSLDTLDTSVYGSSSNAKPLVYVAGLQSWYQALGAVGYKIVMYRNAGSSWEGTYGWLQSVTGDPLANTMVGGADLTPRLYNAQNHVFSGAFVQIPDTAIDDAHKFQGGGNYNVFSGLTNDAVLIRTGSEQSGWGDAALNGFQIVPIFPSLASVGVHFVSAGGNYQPNSSSDTLLPTDSAGIPDYAQTNWNNLGQWGDSVGFWGNTAVVLHDSTGAATSLSTMWDCGHADTTGTAAGLGTPDGKLMDGFLASWGPGAATAFTQNPYNASGNNKPLVYLGGLKAWYQGIGAAGYNVVLYTTGYPSWERAEGFLESATGDPFSWNMVEGDVLTPPLFALDNQNFAGTYVSATATSSDSATWGGNCMKFYGLTNDVILIRLQSLGWATGLSGFQIIPVASIAPVVPPVVTLQSTVTGSTNVLSWSAGTLQTATNVLGPWTYNYTPSPVTVTMTNAAEFYRVWVQ